MNNRWALGVIVKMHADPMSEMILCPSVYFTLIKHLCFVKPIWIETSTLTVDMQITFILTEQQHLKLTSQWQSDRCFCHKLSYIKQHFPRLCDDLGASRYISLLRKRDFSFHLKSDALINVTRIPLVYLRWIVTFVLLYRSI